MILHLTLRKLVIALLLGGTLAVSLHFVYASQDRPPPAAPAPASPELVRFEAGAPQLSALTIGTATVAPLPVSEPLNGRLAYDEDLTARISSPIAGRVTALRRELGDPVRSGAVLAVIDAPELGTAQADWAKARADEQRKRLALERARDLFQAGVLPRKDDEAADADFQQARAETQRATARLNNLRASGGAGDGSFSLRSPVAGVIAERQINPGLEVRPDLAAPLFVVTDLHRLWLLIDLPERNAAAVHAGQAVSLTVDAYPERRFAGVVRRVGLTLDPATRRIQVRCAIDNPDLALKPEMFARATFESDSHGATAVPLPNTSLFMEGMYESVYVETKPNTFARRRVHVALRGHQDSYIDSGLRAGDRVVTEGAFLLNAEAGDHAR
ncbi:efflux RND transporter periplasmic adaptor subunit [Duganella sp. Dugasp56]|uniref:efflux RND transporter periplasmic adaptor subunit n=1 Tax=Duganella sp. Dugasp56 TaxID=3243046 RepID=UPI0039AFFB69